MFLASPAGPGLHRPIPARTRLEDAQASSAPVSLDLERYRSRRNASQVRPHGLVAQATLMQLDTTTLFTSITIANFSGALLLSVLALAFKTLSRQTRKSLSLWITALLISGTACCLLGLRGQISDTLSIFVANAILLVAHGLKPNAVSIFYRGKATQLWFPALTIAGWIGLWFIPEFRGSLPARGLYIHACLIGNIVFSLETCLRHDEDNLVATKVLAGTMGLEALAYLYIAQFEGAAGNAEFEQFFQTIGLTIYLSLILIVVVLMVMSVVAAAVEKAQRDFQDQALLDPLTGLANRRGFQRALKLAPAERKAPYALALLEVDQFETVRRSHGHVMTDTLLRLLSRLCQDGLPKGATVGHFNHGIFVLYVPAANRTSACALVTSIARSFTAESRQASDDRLKLSLSSGIFAEAPGTSLDRAMEIADQCLCRAKAQGGNRIVVNEEAKTEPLRSVTLIPAFPTSQRSMA
jgi:diguanylate cyclase (GGDEF)-like protein